MSWEWELRSRPQRWTLTVGMWHAVVQRLEGPRYQWAAFIESTTKPTVRYDGPTDKDPMIGRTWCLTKIAALRQEKP
jgi:hypothetical protein